MLIQINYDKRNTREVSGGITLPGSKSMAARLLILDFIHDINERHAESEGKRLRRETLPDCDDTRYLDEALRKLARIPTGDEFYLGDGATSLRFFVALLASLPDFDGKVDGSAQLRRRPLAPLVEALRGAGAQIRYLDKEGYLPIYIKGGKLKGGRIEVNGSVSSQFISALKLASLLWQRPAQLTIDGEAVSAPYIKMTERMIEKGIECGIEKDWSAATFFYEVALLLPGVEIRLERLTDPARSMQGDAGVADIFNLLGVETRKDGDDIIIRGKREIIETMRSLAIPMEFDLGGMPDAVPALAVGMALAGIKYRFCNVGHLRHKESNRLLALKNEMEKIGVALEITNDSLSWNGGRLPVAENEVIESEGDHRIAMAFAPAAAKLGYVTIRDPQCVDKSFPDYFGQLAKLGFDARFFSGGKI